MKTKKLAVLSIIAVFALTFGLVTGVKANAENETGAFTSVNLSISEDFTMKYYATLPENSQDVSALFTLAGVGEKTIIPTFEGDEYIFAFNGITPQHLGKEISAEVSYVLNGESKSFTTENLTINTVRGYLENLLSKTAEENGVNEKVNEELKTLAVDILNYGAAAQVYKGDATAPVNANLTEAQKLFGTSFESVKSNVKNALGRSDETETVSWESANLFFENGIALNVKFTLDSNVTAGNVKAYADGKQASLVKDENGVYTLTYGVSAVDYDKNIAFTVKNDDELIGSTLTYSVGSYVYNYISVETETAMSALAKQAYVYGKSVANYVDAFTYVKLTLNGATFADKTTEVYIKPGSALPEIAGSYDGWYNVDNPMEFYLTSEALSGTKSNAKEFAMPAEDTTIAPITFTTVRSDPRTGSTDYFVKVNDETYTEELYGKLSQTRTLYKINSTTVKAVSGFGYVLTCSNGAWVTEKEWVPGKELEKDRIFTRMFTNYGNETVTFAYRLEYYEGRFYQSDMIKLAPGETYTYVYYVPASWLSSRIANSTTSFELYFGESQIDYETVLVHTAQAVELSTAN